MTSTERRTRQRASIRALLAHSGHFLTAQQVYEQLRAAGEAVSLPTVYRTLAGLAEARVLDVLTSQGQTAYRRCSAEHHHHLVCRRCGRAIEVTAAPVEQWAAEVGLSHGFAEIEHLTEISGICPSCQARSVSP